VEKKRRVAALRRETVDKRGVMGKKRTPHDHGLFREEEEKKKRSRPPVSSVGEKKKNFRSNLRSTKRGKAEDCPPAGPKKNENVL